MLLPKSLPQFPTHWYVASCLTPTRCLALHVYCCSSEPFSPFCHSHLRYSHLEMQTVTRLPDLPIAMLWSCSHKDVFWALVQQFSGRHGHSSEAIILHILGYPGVIQLATSTPETISWISFDVPLNEYYHFIGFIIIFTC